MDDLHEQDHGASSPAVRVRYGSKPGASFRVKFLSLKHLGIQAHVVDAEVERFERAALAYSGAGKNHCLLLKPGEMSSRFEFEGFFIEGRFQDRGAGERSKEGGDGLQDVHAELNRRGAGI